MYVCIKERDESYVDYFLEVEPFSFYFPKSKRDATNP
jgi:hypothetical protein